ncbi:hypothetical protein C4E44_06310 [Pseudomonas sp. MWU12-2312b]|nr:hypothetical protein C4E44_06310 [Pseudomonas sp. MWU12-2312b]
MPPVGASLLAMECQSPRLLLMHHREQARSYRGCVCSISRGRSASTLFRCATSSVPCPAPVPRPPPAP